MTIHAGSPTAEAAVSQKIIDCDIHPKLSSANDLMPFLSQRWQDHLKTYGLRYRMGYQDGNPYPKAAPASSRRDTWPAGGGLPGSDVGLLQSQLLDLYDMEFGIMNPLWPTGQGVLGDEFSAALCRATNLWQLDLYNAPEPRLKCSICVPYENGELARDEIRHYAGDRRFAQVLLLSRTAELLGQRRYWPIFEAAQEARLPVGIHVFGYSGQAISAAGWPSYYIEEMTEHAPSAQAMLASMVFEGLFERYPGTRIVLLEAGLAWMPALAWRLDWLWARMRDEVPHVKRPPSEYLRQHVWLATQPMEEPDNKRHLVDVLDWIGHDRVVFSSDYPHWDFDDPRHALPPHIGPELKRAILHDNAAALYGATG